MSRANTPAGRIGLALAALAGVLLTLWATERYGVGTTMDSVNYAAAARSSAAGSGYLMAAGHPMVAWPPLFPTLLGLGVVFGVDPFVAGRYLNALCFGLAIAVGSRLVSLMTNGRGVVWAAACLLLFGPPLVSTSLTCLSDALFLVLVALWILAFARLATDEGRGTLWVAASWGGLSCLDRYAGAVLIVVGALVVVALHGRGWRRRWRALLAHSVVCVAPLVIWVLRNEAVSGTLTGRRAAEPLPFLVNLKALGTTLLGFVAPESVFGVEVPTPARILLATGVLAVVSIGGLGSRGGGRPTRRSATVMTSTVLVVAYLLFLLIASSTARTVPPNTRLLAPVFLPLVFLFLNGIDGIASRSPSGAPLGRRMVLVGSVGLSIWWMLSGLGASLDLWREARSSGGGSSSRRWHESVLVRELCQNPPLRPSHSNVSAQLYVHCGFWSQPVPTSEQRLERLLRPREEVRYLLWYFDPSQPEGRFGRSQLPFRTRQLRRKPGVNIVETYPDGMVLRISARPLGHDPQGRQDPP